MLFADGSFQFITIGTCKLLEILQETNQGLDNAAATQEIYIRVAIVLPTIRGYSTLVALQRQLKNLDFPMQVIPTFHYYFLVEKLWCLINMDECTWSNSAK